MKSVSELLDRFSDAEIDSWAGELLASRAPMFDSLLRHGPHDDVEWGLMDSERHPLHEAFREAGESSDPENPSRGLTAGDNWRWVASTPHSVGESSTQIVDRRQCPVLKHTNSGWDSTLRNLSRVGRPDGSEDGEFLRPEGPFILDLVRSGERLLEAAHVLRHLRGGTLVGWVARVHLMLEFGLPLSIGGEDAFDRLGVMVVPSIDFRRPTGLVPVFGPEAMKPFSTGIVVFHGIHVEPHPKSFEESDGWLEVNRWSCEPSISVIAGFEYPEFVLKSPIVARFPGATRNPMHMVPVPAMLPASSLGIALAHLMRGRAESMDVGTDGEIVQLGDWMDSADYARAVSMTPPLPCRECLRLNTMADGHPLRPRGQRPESLKEVPEDVRREWEEYEEKMERIFRICDRAACYAEGRRVGHSVAKRSRRLRRILYNRSVELANRIESLERRAARYDRRGNIDKAAEHRGKARKLREELEALKNGLH